MEVSRWLFENHPEAIINSMMMGVNVSDRALGRSTGIVLASIGAAMIKPHTPIKVIEFGDLRDRHLMSMIFDIIEKLDLKGFSCHRHNQTITYKPTVNVRLKLEEIE